MSVPTRIQRKRTRGWRMPPNTVYVGRPSRWGNPYKVGTRFIPDAETAVRYYRRWLFTQRRSESVVPALRGHDLACWCRLDEPCHADVLLELANPPGAPRRVGKP